MDETRISAAPNELDEQVWRAWIETGRVRDKARARRRLQIAAVSLVLLAVVAGGYYLLRLYSGTS